MLRRSLCTHVPAQWPRPRPCFPCRTLTSKHQYLCHYEQSHTAPRHEASTGSLEDVFRLGVDDSVFVHGKLDAVNNGVDPFEYKSTMTTQRRYTARNCERRLAGLVPARQQRAPPLRGAPASSSAPARGLTMLGRWSGPQGGRIFSRYEGEIVSKRAQREADVTCSERAKPTHQRPT